MQLAFFYNISSMSNKTNYLFTLVTFFWKYKLMQYKFGRVPERFSDKTTKLYDDNVDI